MAVADGSEHKEWSLRRVESGESRVESSTVKDRGTARRPFCRRRQIATDPDLHKGIVFDAKSRLHDVNFAESKRDHPSLGN